MVTINDSSADLTILNVVSLPSERKIKVLLRAASSPARSSSVTVGDGVGACMT